MKRAKHKIIFLSILIVIALFIKIITSFPNIVENIYSRSIYKIIIKIISNLSRLLPFSVAEIMIALVFIILLALLIKNTKNIILLLQLNPKIFFIKSIYYITSGALIIYIIFMLLWGFNYYRIPLKAYNNNYMPSQKDIEKLALILVKEANELRSQITTDELEEYSLEEASKLVYNNYSNVFNTYNFLEFNYSIPKPIATSRLFTMMQITGIYSPFTSEANFNTEIPNISLPFTIAHEMSHQAGISYEDEANFLAYLVNLESENLYMKYSGTFMALLYTLSALDKNEEYKKIINKLNVNVLNDIRNYYEFWSVYDNKPIANISSKINDTYLKANNQNKGIKSYSDVINLLAYYRLK